MNKGDLDLLDVLSIYAILYQNSTNILNCVCFFSGGKDSCYNMMCCIAEGHDIVALVNLKPGDKGILFTFCLTALHCGVFFNKQQCFSEKLHCQCKNMVHY